MEMAPTPRKEMGSGNGTPVVGPVGAEVVQAPTGLFGALLLEGLHAGRWWALEGHWTIGQQISVRYHPADQFAEPVPHRDAESASDPDWPPDSARP